MRHSRFLLQRKQDGEGAALARRAGQADFTAMGLDDMTHQSQADAGPLDAAGPRIGAPDESAEYLLLLRYRDALTLVTQEDKALLRDIEKILGRPIERRTVEGFNYDESKKDDAPRFKPQGVKQSRPAFWSEKETRAKKRSQSSAKDRRWENFYQAA